MVKHLSAAPTGDYSLTVLPSATHQLMVGDDYHPLYFESMTGWLRARF